MWLTQSPWQEVPVPTLQLVSFEDPADSHKGEISACCFAADGQHVLSGGWDGYLRLWNVTSGATVTSLRTGPKPLSACAISPDGAHWLAGNLDGMLSRWDAMTQKLGSTFLAHPRPISSIGFGPDGHMVTSSWDTTLILWEAATSRDGRSLRGHDDIVAGCEFSPNGKMLLSCSYDTTLRLWDVERARSTKTLAGHADRVLCTAISPNGNWAASGARDGHVKLWDLASEAEMGGLILDGEVRNCFFLPGGEMLATVEASGRIRLHSVPDLETETEIDTNLTVECGDISPTGSHMALGTNDGAMRLVTIEGFEDAPLFVTATQSSRTTATPLQRLLGRRQVKHVYICTCPACRQQVEMPNASPEHRATCPHCRRPLRVRSVVPLQALSS
jgi:WD40 repeat protein